MAEAELIHIRAELDDQRRAQLLMCRALGPLIEDPMDPTALAHVNDVQAMLVASEVHPAGRVPLAAVAEPTVGS